MEKHVAERFYEAFVKKDAEAMADCYADDAQFSDEVFVGLSAQEVRNMWRMLCKRSPDLTVKFTVLEKAHNSAKVHWDAWYTFSKTGRAVHNSVTAHLTIREDKIVRHQDHFSFWRWSRQALGMSGLLLGWTPLIKNKVRKEGRRGLDAFISNAKA